MLDCTGRDNDGDEVRVHVRLYIEYRTSKNGVTIVGTNDIKNYTDTYDRHGFSGGRWANWGPGKDYYGNTWRLDYQSGGASWQNSSAWFWDGYLYKNEVQVATIGQKSTYYDDVIYTF